MKKFLSILLALMMVLTLMAPAAFADNETTTPGTEIVDPEPSENPEPPVEPEVPTIEVTASNNPTSGKVVLTWAAVEGAAKYEVYRSGTKDGEYKLYYTTTKLTYTNTSAYAGYWYHYKVKALDADGNEIVTSAIITQCSDCAAPVITAGNNASTGKVVLTWKPIEGAAKYEVYRSGTKDGTYKLYCTLTSTTYTNTSANAGYTYYYKVKAISKVMPEGNSAFSTVVSRTCDCAMPSLELIDYDTDGTPLYYIDYNNNGNIIFKWSKVSGAGSYKVYRSGTMNGTYKLLGETKSTTFTDKTATAGYYYYYKIVAISSRTSYADSAAFQVVAAPSYPAVKNLKGSSSSSGITLKWDPVKGVDGYIIAMGSSKDIDKMKGVYTVEGTKVTDSRLSSGYWYAVIAYKYRSDGNVITSVPSYVFVK